jgi:hypothetical protein
LFSNSCKPFFEECYRTAYDIGFTPPNFDETIYNSMLWKYGSTDYVDCYDPYFGYFENRDEGSRKTHGYDSLDNINFYICHGSKDVGHARNIMNNIQDNLYKGKVRNNKYICD